MSLTIVLSIAGVLVLFYLYGLYVSVIKNKNNVQEAMSGVDVQLRKRYDLIPNILTIANRYMEHEKGLLEEITALRAKASSIKTNASSMKEKIDLDNAIASKMGQLFVIVENYPQLKADNTMMQAMQTYSEVEEHIAAARRFYNSSVKTLNNMVEIFPSSVVAAFVGVNPYPFFETDEGARQSINASDYLYKN